LLLLLAGFAVATPRGRRVLMSLDPLYALLVIAVLVLPYLIWLLRADALADLVEVLRRVHAEDADLALVRREQAQDVVQQRRLAAAVGPQDAHPAALLDHEVGSARVHLPPVGVGGQPGIATSTGMTFATRPREA